jgi:aerobic-type carbon monoxide dehydrogenase small subunit (CoxS/CutS family)
MYRLWSVAMETTVSFIVNGEKKTVTTDTGRSLLDVLREDLHLTGTKYGCGEGACGACTILMDGEPVLSCVAAVAEADKKRITTIEGLSTDESLHPVQEAFLEEGAIQCGYCTSGMVLTAAALLEKSPNPTDEEIVEAMNGNICRCNGYVKILNAVRSAAEKMGR